MTGNNKLSIESVEKLHSDPAGFIKHRIKDFVRMSPANQLSFANNYIMWDEPLIEFADGDDPIFMEYKNIILPAHRPMRS